MGYKEKNGNLYKNIWRKYPKVSVATIGKLQENTRALCKMAAKFSQQRDNIFAAQGWFRSRAKIPSTWSDLLAMAVTPSFQLRIMHRLKHWILDFLIFEMVYSMYKIDFGKCSKSSWHDCYQEYFMADFSLHSRFAYGKGLQSFGSSCFWAFHFFSMDSK